jgi:hypothetical protein
MTGPARGWQFFIHLICLKIKEEPNDAHLQRDSAGADEGRDCQHDRVAHFIPKASQHLHDCS